MADQKQLITAEATESSCYKIVELTHDLVADEEMKAAIAELEDTLKYRFRDKTLLEDALTHSSCNSSRSYERLEFVGDAALSLAFSNFLYLAYPDLEPGDLSLIRAANISTEKLARLAIRHNLHRFIRLNAPALVISVEEFALAIQSEDDPVAYGGPVKAPKLLADIVESIAAAIYVDCGFDLKAFWMIFRGFLEPIVMLENLVGRPQPVTMLYELCQKNGKEVDIKHWRNGLRSIASVYVDGEFVASGSSSQKETAKLNAAEEALRKLQELGLTNDDTECWVINEEGDIEGAKQKINELCGKKRLGKPIYRIQKEYGPSHDKRYTCSVQIEMPSGILAISGNEKPRVKDAETSAASMMLQTLSTFDPQLLRFETLN